VISTITGLATDSADHVSTNLLRVKLTRRTAPVDDNAATDTTKMTKILFTVPNVSLERILCTNCVLGPIKNGSVQVFTTTMKTSTSISSYCRADPRGDGEIHPYQSPSYVSITLMRFFFSRAPFQTKLLKIFVFRGSIPRSSKRCSCFRRSHMCNSDL